VAAGTRLAAAVAAEKLDEFGNPVQLSCRHRTQPLKPRGTIKRKRATIDDDETDVGDKNFAASSTEDGSDDNSDIMDISNEEVRMVLPDFGTNDFYTLQVADMLPSKTIPKVNRKRHTRTLKAKVKMTMAPPNNKARARSVEVEETEDDNSSPRNITTRNTTNASSNVSISSTSSFQISHPKKVCSLLCRA
jgi:hypothetical protein